MQYDHSLESYLTVLSCGAVCLVTQFGSIFSVCGSNHAVLPFFAKLLLFSGNLELTERCIGLLQISRI